MDYWLQLWWHFPVAFGISFYRASVATGLGLPAWALLAVLVPFPALLSLYILRGREPRCKLCHISHRIYGSPPGRHGGCC